MSHEAAQRWIRIWFQLQAMQRDIKQSKIQGPGSGKAR